MIAQRVSSASQVPPPAIKIFEGAVPDGDLVNFLDRIVARENPDLAGGSPQTLQDYRIQVRTAQRFLDKELTELGQPTRRVTVYDLCDALVAGCMAWMKDKGRSPDTCNKFRRSILAIHNFAIDEKELPLKRMRVKKYKVPKRKPQCWLGDELIPILTAAGQMPGKIGEVPASKWCPALLLFILNTGTRITAVMETPTARLDLERAWVKIPAEIQKHDSDEVFDLLPSTVLALAAIHPHRHARIFDDWPYDRTNGGKWPALIKLLKRILVKAGIYSSVRDVSSKDLFHKLRRCFASFVNQKAGKRVAQQLLGHSHESVTSLYLDERMDPDRPKVAELLSGMPVFTPPDRQRRLFE